MFSQFGGKFDISPTAVFDYPTIGELAVHLVSQLPDTDTQSTPTEPHLGPEVAAADPTGPESAGQSGPTPRD